MERRAASRHLMIKGAQIVCGGTSLNCAAFDLSVAGTRLCLLEYAEIPERVLLKLPGGAVRVARRCWQRGVEVGFEFIAQREALSRVP
ncbi:hypothetical protein D9599_27400 [Roseomonas sp. KE2513]|nr:hypothetical protein [Roseomonas sp. KE2513]